MIQFFDLIKNKKKNRKYSQTYSIYDLSNNFLGYSYKKLKDKNVICVKDSPEFKITSHKFNKEYSKIFYSDNKSLTSIDKTIREYPEHNFKFPSVVNFVNKILNIINRDYTKINHRNPEPCLYDPDNDYFWDYDGCINIYCNHNLSKSEIKRINRVYLKIKKLFGYDLIMYEYKDMM